MSDNAIIQVNPAELLQTETGGYIQVADRMDKFKEFLKDKLIDGVDYGIIPVGKNSKTPPPKSLFKPGAEKIQMYLGLTPMYRLLCRSFIENRNVVDKVWNEDLRKYERVENCRNYYSWEWACDLYYNGVKVSEGVGMANTEEDKYTKQYANGKTPDSLSNTVMKISKKRAFVDAIIAVSGVSDIFAQDLEDDALPLKSDKSNGKNKKLTRNQLQRIYANLGAFELTKETLTSIINKYGFNTPADIEQEKLADILSDISKAGKNKKGTNV